ncbi:hypothetical protein SLA2020_265640 [Shorea laevis]
MAPKQNPQSKLDFWTPRDRTPVVRPVRGSDETTQDSRETHHPEEYYIPAPYVLLDLLRDITPGECARKIDELIGMHEPDTVPGYYQWSGLSCNRREPEREVDPDREDGSKIEDGPEREHGSERESQTSAQSVPDPSQHSGASR